MSKKTKNEILENNADLNISEYDKQLSDNALLGIVSAKRNYNKALENNDSLGMAKANAYANSIRKSEGGYTGGDDGSAYYPSASFKKTERKEYKSEYADEIDELYKTINDREEFSYDVYEDPVFELYKNVYEQAGNLAYERALASNASKTGGMANTNALTAASQARAYYDIMLAQKAVDMYNNAYDRYADTTKELYDRLDALRLLEHDDYYKYADYLKSFENDREFEYDMYRDVEKDLRDDLRYEIENDYRKNRDDVSDDRWREEFEYDIRRDAAEDLRKREEFDYKKYRDSAEDDMWRMEHYFGDGSSLVNTLRYASMLGINDNIQPYLTMLGIVTE